MRGRLIPALIGGCLAGPAVAAPETPPRLSEIVVSVSDLARFLDALTGPLRGRVIERGPADPSVARVLGLPVETPVDQALVAVGDRPGGRLRLVAVRRATDAETPAPIRPGGGWWDSGGLMNLSLAVADVAAARDGLRRLGWGTAGPIRVEGDGHHADLRGPDDLLLSLRDRAGGDTGFNGISVVKDLDAWRRLVSGVFDLDAGKPRRATAVLPGLPDNTANLGDHRETAVALDGGPLTAWQWSRAGGRDVAGDVHAPNLGAIAVRVAVDDVARVAARAKANGAPLAAELQIEKLSPYGIVRTVGVRLPGGLTIEAFSPGAAPMTEAELKTMFAGGGYATWVRFNNKLTGDVRWNADGTAHVRWDTGYLDELGTWSIKGDAVCTPWTRLRSNREVCVHHFRLDQTTTEAFRIEGLQPDGIYHWRDTR